MAWFGRRRDRESREREEQRLPPPETVSALPVDPRMVKEAVIEELFSAVAISPEKAESLYIGDLDKILSEESERLYQSVSASLRQLSLNMVNIVNTKSIKSSVLLILDTMYSIVNAKVYSMKVSIEKLSRDMADPSLKPDERARVAVELLRKVLAMLAVPTTANRLIKDIDTKLALNLPFHLKPDLLRNLIGYTST